MDLFSSSKAHHAFGSLTGVFHLRVPESAPEGSSVGKIKAHDLDMGTNAEVAYRIIPGDSSSTFDIYTDSSTQEGIVVLKKVNKWIDG